VLTVATSDGDPPANYKNETGNPAGTDLDLAAEWAKKLGLQLEIQWLDWPAAQAAVAAGRADLIVGGMAKTEERAKVYFLTDPIGYNGMEITQRKDSNFSRLEDFKDGNYKYGTIAGYPYVPYLRKVPGIGDNLVVYPTPDLAIKDLVDGRVDALSMCLGVPLYNLYAHPELPIKAVKMPKGSGDIPEDIWASAVVAGVYKNEPELGQALNPLIAEEWDSGFLTEVYVKYFGSEGGKIMTEPFK
jgi:polar amino acid transport system substrate-binding protein